MSLPNGKKYIQYIENIQHIIWDMDEENIQESVEIIINLFDANFPYSFKLILCQLIISSFISQMKDFNIYLYEVT